MMENCVAELWSCLPHHVVEEILCKLPCADQLKLRLTCKQWNASILSRGLRHNPRRRALLASVSEDSKVLTTYDKSKRTWQPLPLTFIALDLSVFTLVVSDGGLLCFQCDRNSDQFLVCNPIIRTWKTLPRVHGSAPVSETLSWDVVGLVTQKDESGYRLIVMGRGDGRSVKPVVRTYVSSLGCWLDTDSHHGMSRVSLISIRGKAVSARGFLYTMVCEMGLWYLLSYDLNQGTWTRLLAPDGICQPDVFEHEGEIYLVAQCWEIILGPELCVWKLHKSGQIWSRSKSIFRDLCVVFRQMPDYWRVKSHPLGDDACICICVGQDRSLFAVGLESSGSIAVWTYDLKTESYTSLPVVASRDFVPQVACVFHPSLTARV